MYPITIQCYHVTPYGTQHILIAWEGLLDFESTWEDYDLIDYLYPTFHLKDKVYLLEGEESNDRPLQVYLRRNKKTQPRQHRE